MKNMIESMGIKENKPFEYGMYDYKISVENDNVIFSFFNEETEEWEEVERYPDDIFDFLKTAREYHKHLFK